MAELIVRAVNQRATSGHVEVGGQRYACALGRTGLARIKREGDGKTPIGRWAIRRIYYRPDRISAGQRPVGGRGIEVRALKPDDGWCDGVGDRNYNRAVKLPYPGSHEELWRTDGLYDVIVVLDHNERPRIQGGGSAIFMHVARMAPSQDLQPTAGCVALRLRDLDIVLSRMRMARFVRILEGP